MPALKSNDGKEATFYPGRYTPSMRFIAAIASLGLIVTSAGVVSGQHYPNKSIRIVTGLPGAGSDFTTRQIAQGISGPLGQPVIIDNRGAGILSANFWPKRPPIVKREG